MKVDIEKHGTVTVIAPTDSLIESALPDMREALEETAGGAGTRRVIDMSNVAFVDSLGIEFLLDHAGNNAGGPIQPRLAALSDTVRESLHVTETLRSFVVFESVEAAVRSYL